MCKVLKTQGINPDLAIAEDEEDAEEIRKEWYFVLIFLMGCDQIHFS